MDLHSLLENMGLIDAFSGSFAPDADDVEDPYPSQCEPSCGPACSASCLMGCSAGTK